MPTPLQLGGEALREADEAELRRAVRHDVRLGDGAVDRGDVHDAAPSRRRERRERRPREQVARLEVRVEDPVPVLFLELRERAPHEDARVVHDDVDARRLLERPRHELLDRRARRDVRRERAARARRAGAPRPRSARPRRPNGTRGPPSPPRAQTRGRWPARCRGRRPSRSRSALPGCGTRRKVSRPLQSRHETPSRVRAPRRRRRRAGGEGRAGAPRVSRRATCRAGPFRSPSRLPRPTPPRPPAAIRSSTSSTTGRGTRPCCSGTASSTRSKRTCGTGRLPEMIVVCPRGPGTWWIDAQGGSRRMAAFLSDDLVPFVDRTWRTRADARRPARRRNLDGRLRRPALGARAARALRRGRGPLPGDPAALRALRRRAAVLHPARRSSPRSAPIPSRTSSGRTTSTRCSSTTPLWRDGPRSSSCAAGPRTSTVSPRSRGSSTASSRPSASPTRYGLETGVHDWPYWRRVFPDFAASLASHLASGDAP